MSELQITIVGHATTLINFDGQRILTALVQRPYSHQEDRL